MKKYFVILFVLLFAGTAFAGDVVIEKRIAEAKLKQDSKGKNYAMFVVSAKQELNGISYDRDTLIFAFGDQYEKVKHLKKGDTLKAICSERIFQGQRNYTVLKTLP